MLGTGVIRSAFVVVDLLQLVLLLSVSVCLLAHLLLQVRFYDVFQAAVCRGKSNFRVIKVRFNFVARKYAPLKMAQAKPDRISRQSGYRIPAGD